MPTKWGSTVKNQRPLAIEVNEHGGERPLYTQGIDGGGCLQDKVIGIQLDPTL